MNGDASLALGRIRIGMLTTKTTKNGKSRKAGRDPAAQPVKQGAEAYPVEGGDDVYV